MKRIFLLVFVLRLFSGYSGSPVDSLKILLKEAKHDTSRCRILNQLVEIDNDDNSWPAYNQEICRIAELNLKTAKVPYSRTDSVFLRFLCNGWSLKGYVAHNKSDYTNAVAYYNKALELSERINEHTVIADVYNNLAGVYSDQKQHSQSVEFFKKSLAIRLLIKDREGIAQSYTNLATAYETLGDTAAERMYFNKALEEVAGKLSFREGIILVNMSTMFKKRNNSKSALEYAERAVQLNEKIGNKRAVCVALGNIAYINISENKFAEAEKYAKRSIALAYELGFPTHIATGALNLQNIYSGMGNYKEALHYYKIYVRMRDSTNNSENAKLAMREQLKFEYEKKKAVDDAVHKQDMIIATEKQQKQRLFTALVALVLLMVVVFLFFVYYRLKHTKKQNVLIESQKKTLEEKNHIIEEKQKEIIDSITYAKRIQYALLAHDDLLQKNLNEYFVFFKPKDIVSGDFYWATHVSLKHNNQSIKEDKSSNTHPESSNLFYLAVCDSTGHGVPGAFMSLLNISFLNEAITEKKIYEPHQVLNYVREKLIQEISGEGAQDGMDGILLCIKTELYADGTTKKKYSYAAANNHPVIVRNGLPFELAKDKMPVGKGENMQSFTLHQIDAMPGDIIYIYTDGFADQFGGPKGKKFKYKPLNNLLTANSSLPASEQKLRLQSEFDSWKNGLEQVDDVCVIGLYTH